MQFLETTMVVVAVLATTCLILGLRFKLPIFWLAATIFFFMAAYTGGILKVDFLGKRDALLEFLALLLGTPALIWITSNHEAGQKV